MTKRISEKKLRKICKHAEEHFLSNMGAFRHDKAITCKIKAFPDHCLKYDNICIASAVFSVGHPKLSAKTDIKKMYECPHRQPDETG